MVQPIIHIGFHKTATSWFQKSFYGASTSHRLVDRILVRKTFLGGTAFDFDPAWARAELGFKSGERPPLICDEDLSGFLHNGLTAGYVAKEIAHRLHETVPDAQIVIFVRAQPSAALSWYEQYLREGGTASARRYLFPGVYRHLGKSRPFKFPCFDFAQLDYRGLIEHYDALFGASNVHVFAYEQLAQDRDGLLDAMTDRLGLEIDFSQVCNRPVNASYRIGLLPIARVLNLFTNRSVANKRTVIHIPYWYPVRKLLLEQLNRLPVFGTRPRPETIFSPETIAWIHQRFWSSNQWLATRMHVDIKALGYVVDPPLVPVAQPGRPAALAWVRN